PPTAAVQTPGGAAGYQRRGGARRLRTASGDHLDPQPVRVAEVDGVVTRAVAGPRAGGAVAAAARRQRRVVGGVHRRLPDGAHGDVAVGVGGAIARGDPEGRVGDAVGDRLVGAVHAPHAERGEDGVVE